MTVTTGAGAGVGLVAGMTPNAVPSLLAPSIKAELKADWTSPGDGSCWI